MEPAMEIIRDMDCNADMPLRYGFADSPIWGQGKPTVPRYPGKRGSPYEQKMLLPALLPLEKYDRIVVLYSAGKDSTAVYLKLRELGVPNDKIELWHHDLDGGHPSRKMDWPVTKAYVNAFAKAYGVRLRVSRRVNGYWGEVYRVGASYPIEYEDGGGFTTCPLSPAQKESEQLRKKLLTSLSCDGLAALKEFGFREKFPAKSGDLSRRWCSACLKIDVASAVLRNLKSLGHVEKFPAKGSIGNGRYCSPQLKREVADQVLRNLTGTLPDGGHSETKVLICSGERRGESAGRAKYNEMELHRTNATTRAHRLVHQWRPVIDYTEKDIWEVLRRHRVTPHPCYTCGWSRCSCMLCIFGLPTHWAGIRELFPEEYEAVRQDEIRLGFTLDNKKSLDEFVGKAQSCVVHGHPKAIYQLTSGIFTVNDIHTKGVWSYPAGAFHGSEGGPC